MRTVNSDIEIPVVHVMKGKKLILSVRDTIINHSIRLTPMPDTLNYYDAGLFTLAQVPAKSES